MSLQAKIEDSQRTLLDELARCESQLSELYALYARSYPEATSIWLQLSKEERAHERFLKSLHKLLDEGQVFYNLGRFNAQALQTFTAELTSSLEVAKQKDIPLLKAFETALFLENSVIDGHFYDLAKNDAHGFAVVADHLSRDTDRHRKQLQEQYDAYRSRG